MSFIFEEKDIPNKSCMSLKRKNASFRTIIKDIYMPNRINIQWYTIYRTRLQLLEK